MPDSTTIPTPTIAGTDEHGNSINVPYAGSPQEAANKPSLIVTSGASRNDYANNVNTMTTAAQSLTPAKPISTSTDANGNVSTYNSDGTRTTTDKAGNKITPQTPVNVLGDSQTGAKVTKSVAETNGSMTVTYDDGTQAKFVQNPDGTYKQDSTSSTSESGGSTGDSSQSGDGSAPKMNSSLDPSVMKAYQDSIGNLDASIASAKDALTQATATLANDPAAQAAVAQIMAKYDTQIQLMKDKNAMLLGSYRTNAARSGSLQYANDMYSNFMSEEQDRATQRITDLISQETQLVLKSQQASKDGDVKALASATKAYQDANKAKIDAIGKLLTATNNQTKTLQAQQKIDQATTKNQLAFDTKTATSIADGIVKAIKDAGVTDESKINDYIDAMAETNGITNADVLRGAVTKAQQTASKLDLSAKNIESTIANRGKKTSTGAKTASTAAAIKEAGGILTTGINAAGKKVGAPKGTDGFADPYLYIAMYNQIKSDSNQGPAGVNAFLKAYPPAKYLNPSNATNTDLPEEVRNAITAGQKKTAATTVVPQ